MKKIISMLLVVSMAVTFMTPVMASAGTKATSESTSSSNSADQGLENAIKAVKEKIDIPEDCNKFTYNIYNQNDLAVWRLAWSNEETQKRINVSIDENNLITNYSSYQYTSDSDSKKIPKYSKEEGQKIAEDFINNLDPKLLPQYKLSENERYSSDTRYYYIYIRQVNGIEYNQNNVTITVDSSTGEITKYACGYTKDTIFEDASKIISLEQAQKAFIEKLGLKLVYNVKTENEKPVTYLAYIPKDSNKYIDAVTGEIETESERYGIDTKSSMDEKGRTMDATGEAYSAALTPDEVEAVEGISNIITKEDADKKIRVISLFNLDTEFKLESSRLRKDSQNEDSFFWRLSYTKVIDKDTKETRDVYVKIDAKTGEILNFQTSYSSPEGTKPQKTKDQAKVICDDVLKSLIPNTYAKVKYDDTYYTYNDKTQSEFSFKYVRMENGLECPSDYVSISYDNLSGNVCSMKINWTNNLTFGDSAEATSIEKANQVLFSKIGYSIQYVNGYSEDATEKTIATEEDTTKAVLGYFLNTNKPNIISATTGDILNYSGNVYKESSITDYTDINELEVENQIKILTQMSIKYNESELKPNETLLQKDYFLILGRLNDLYYVDQSLDNDKNTEQMYNELIYQGIITKAEKAPESTLTKEEAAKFFIKFIRMSQIAEIKDIFKCNFKDADKISPDLIGYVCLASGLKAMNGSDEYFMPKNKITRLEGLMSIYSYLCNK